MAGPWLGFGADRPIVEGDFGKFSPGLRARGGFGRALNSGEAQICFKGLTNFFLPNRPCYGPGVLASQCGTLWGIFPEISKALGFQGEVG